MHPVVIFSPGFSSIPTRRSVPACHPDHRIVLKFQKKVWPWRCMRKSNRSGQTLFHREYTVFDLLVELLLTCLATQLLPLRLMEAFS